MTVKHTRTYVHKGPRWGMEALGAQGEGIGRDQRNLNPDSPPVFQKYLKYFQKWVWFGSYI